MPVLPRLPVTLYNDRVTLATVASGCLLVPPLWPGEPGVGSGRVSLSCHRQGR